MDEVQNEEKNSKLSSRKFVVWLTWLIVTVLVLGYGIVVTVITKQIVDSCVSLIEKVLGWFFGISMMYLGMNVGQKVGMSVAENMKGKE